MFDYDNITYIVKKGFHNFSVHDGHQNVLCYHGNLYITCSMPAKWHFF